MLNQVVLVGRINSLENYNNGAKLVLAVPRSYKNSEGVYETDFIQCMLFNNMASNILEYCQRGDLVGIKGRLETTNNHMEVCAEKVTFLSSKSN